jgi:hypothetical protein
MYELRDDKFIEEGLLIFCPFLSATKYMFQYIVSDILQNRLKEDTKHKYIRTAFAQPATKAANRDSPQA